jgi:Tfp pilus assembly protein PilV
MNGTKNGFSSVELLITLFVAVAFLATGYQIYIAVAKNSAQSQYRSSADSIAKDYLNRVSSVRIPCPTSSDESIIATINNDEVHKIISAPYGCSSSHSIIKVEIKVLFPVRGVQNSVTHVRYVEA